MLEELRIHNFAVIDRLELTFGPGFNVITGETGAGKSILVDAVELLLGARADPVVVRAGGERSRIEGLFKLDSRARRTAMPLLEREDLVDEDQPEYLSIMREVRRRGRSSARINGFPVRSDLLNEVGGALVDIHGQSQHLSLFRPRHHIDLLDRYADLLDMRLGLARMVAELTQIQAEMRSLRDDQAALRRRADMLRHELEEIRAAELDPAEESDLYSERNRLANSEQLATLAADALQLLNGDESGRALPAVDGLMAAAAALAKLSRIDPAMTDHYSLAEELAQQAQDLALTLARYADEVEYDPQRLDELEGRLEHIRTLKRRFSAKDINELLAYADSAATELQSLDASDEHLDSMQRRENALMRQIGDICWRLSQARAEAADELSDAILRELADLRMERSRFEALLQQAEHPDGCIVGDKRYKFDAKGMDDVEFMLSANPGEPPRPLAKVASGGEAARIMLALKRVLTAADQRPTLIFDEVDQGIGGRIGAVVGEKLWSLSSEHQVLCVTHLPQLACYADAHFLARKSLSDDAAATQVRELTDEAERVAELAAMLGTAGAAGMESARELLERARVRKGRA